MTEQKILQLVIRKALERGWDAPNKPWTKYTQTNLFLEPPITFDEYASTIFSHEFAKAFWGEAEIVVMDKIRYRKHTNEDPNIPPTYLPDPEILSTGAIAWQYHLQQMVLESDPLSYLAKFLE